ncbi:hypothetical protein Back2_18120 [Nocardioides baekrokdamisoli]|uniref:Uncharacterized protein n=1 Tax=Nocardioides baekrokdamisoli TaxID=1804624 RepID=A0A3G9INB2_9ACTN|nr:hypothetical protein [Nocardioides baekrokdamisoli]BBH17525.1 hypothetical protein Back2_18120 [Nocardioides baekrokdamisoli]
MTARDRLRAELLEVAEYLHPRLRDEIEWLYGEHDVLQARNEEYSELARRHHVASVMVGELRQQLVRAERKLEDCAVQEVAKAKRVATFRGNGYLQVTSLGGGKYTIKHVWIDEVRRAD